MELRYLTKEESNQIREREFLALTPAERFFAFLELSRRINRLFPSKVTFEERTKGNFILKRK
ncbi:hypothetical protein SAMN03080598_03365 [Algoriphagus boritolerans DSM 17298 = JCM 18970]|uniref:Uncharacterized protein n=1 Tax=Algoriphagus boritolerans DSM 17298 = JCM 18970 TaxID=1120964 RepID=A0A1H5Z868_9BACT|nr:hypothetical protein SAMN03080598_03365 [Algoriphagus boritolerans DSM 17298 = JCM 18970]